jgi:hypothetical protein
MDTDIRKIGELADLESFDPAAFKADGKVSQDVCNFVLTLGLIFNDLKDLIYAHVLLQTQTPEGKFKITRHWGDYSGIEGHIIRLMLGLFREILVLIDANDNVLSDPYFQSVIFSLKKEERSIWDSLIATAQGKKPTTPEGVLALKARNAVTFHYEPKAIYKGYSEFFSSGSHGSEKAFISRGDGTADTRLFFADAAIAGYFRTQIGDGDVAILDKTLKQLLDSLILFKIVHNFIQKRSFAYRSEAEET